MTGDVRILYRERPPRRHRLMHWLAVRSRRGCPSCGLAIMPLDTWGVWLGEVWHATCLEEELRPGAPPRTYLPR